MKKGPSHLILNFPLELHLPPCGRCLSALTQEGSEKSLGYEIFELWKEAGKLSLPLGGSLFMRLALSKGKL